MKKDGYKVISHDEALVNLSHNNSRLKEIAITIDDGFYSVLKYAVPELGKFSFPATLYITTYYVVKHSSPVYRLALQYMFWKTDVPNLDIDILLSDFKGATLIGFQSINETLCDKLMDFGEQNLSEQERVSLLKKLGEMLLVPLSGLLASRAVSLLNPDEISCLASYGIDVQLHTHRHRFPHLNTDLSEEIIANRDYLGSMTSTPLIHFCYPSGEWRQDQWHVLTENKVLSATTCEPGFKQLLRDVRNYVRPQ